MSTKHEEGSPVYYHDTIDDFAESLLQRMGKREPYRSKVVQLPRTALEACEWAARDDESTGFSCPVCNGHKGDGHAEDCTLARALRRSWGRWKEGTP